MLSIQLGGKKYFYKLFTLHSVNSTARPFHPINWLYCTFFLRFWVGEVGLIHVEVADNNNSSDGDYNNSDNHSFACESPPLETGLGGGGQYWGGGECSFWLEPWLALWQPHGPQVARAKTQAAVGRAVILLASWFLHTFKKMSFFLSAFFFLKELAPGLFWCAGPCLVSANKRVQTGDNQLPYCGLQWAGVRQASQIPLTC